MDLISFIQSLSYTAPTVEDPEPEPVELVVSENSVTYTGAQSWFSWLSGKNTERLFNPRMLHDPSSGKTYDLYQGKQLDGYGQLKLMTFDSQAGFDRPVTVGGIVPKHSIGVWDTHTVGTLALSIDPSDGKKKIYATQEITHLVPLTVYKGVNGDGSRFTTPFQIGVNLAYANIFKGPGGHDYIWCRGGNSSGDENHLYSIFVVESENYFEGLDTATPRQITQRPMTGLWHYPGLPFGYHKVENTWYLLVTLRTGGADGGTVSDNEAHSAFYLLLTDDFITYRNYQNTFSHSTTDDGVITDAILQANFMYYQTDDVTVQGRSPIAGVSSTGFFACIVGNHTNDGTYRFLYYQNGVVVDKPITIPDMLVVDTESQTGPFNYLIIRSENDIMVKCDIDDGVYVRPHFFRTTNLGESWADMGDWFDDIPNKTLALRIPNNILQIPENQNFMIAAIAEDSSDRAFYYGKVAAWGSLQAIPGLTITPASEMNYNSTGLFHYKCTDGNLTKTGNNVTAFIDLLGIRNATAVNNPQWNGSDRVTFLSASSQRLTYGTPAGLVNKNAFTYWAVVACPTRPSNLITFSLNSDTDRYIQVRNQGGGSDGIMLYHVVNDSGNTCSVYATDLINDSNLHLMWLEVDGDRSIKFFIDGRLQFFVTNQGDATTQWDRIGKGPAYVGANVVNANFLDLSSGDAYTNQVKAEEMMYDGIMPAAESRARMYRLCQDYGITYLNQFATPA